MIRVNEHLGSLPESIKLFFLFFFKNLDPSQLSRRNGIVYSITFCSKPCDWIPQTGDFLGDLTNDTPNNSIERFVTGGPMNRLPN